MIDSILIGIFTASLILLCTILRKFFSLISIFLGNRIPTLYFIIGISFGGELKHAKTMLYWPGFISAMSLALFFIIYFSRKNKTDSYNPENPNPVTLKMVSSGFFLLGGLIGMVYHLIRY
jgi:hypothetical protein